MVLEPHSPIAGEPEYAPRMLKQPSEAPTTLGHVGDTESLRSFRQDWESRRASHTFSPGGDFVHGQGASQVERIVVSCSLLPTPPTPLRLTAISSRIAWGRKRPSPAT